MENLTKCKPEEILAPSPITKGQEKDTLNIIKKFQSTRITYNDIMAYSDILKNIQTHHKSK